MGETHFAWKASSRDSVDGHSLAHEKLKEVTKLNA
jgi:hypothetical protein